MLRLDTHVVVWLYAGLADRLSPAGRDLIEADTIAVSPIVGLELTYLRAVGRLTVDGPTVIADLGDRIGLQVSDLSFNDVIEAAGALDWTRDVFDRLIVADAIVSKATLLTKDRTIRENVALARW